MTKPLTPTTDEQYLIELRESRAHDLAMRKSDNDRAVKIAQEETERRETGRRYVVVGLVVFVLGAILASLIYWGIWNTRSDDAARDRQVQLNGQIAEACIAAGNIWYDGNCLITKNTP